VTAIIAWTYLMHAYYRREGVDIVAAAPAWYRPHRAAPRSIGSWASASRRAHARSTAARSII
jgi:hypothetical protein